MVASDGWEPPADVAPWMVCAAIKCNKTIVTSARHFDELMHKQLKAADLDWVEERWGWEQGFIDQWGRFYNRTEAMAAVKRSNQPFNKERNGNQTDELYSEGLY